MTPGTSPQAAPSGKVYPSPGDALQDVFPGATVLVAGSAAHGWPQRLVSALAGGAASGLTVVCQGTWPGPNDGAPGTDAIEALLAGGLVSRLVSSLPFGPGGPVAARWQAGDLEVEVVSQGVLAERLRAGGAGTGGVFLPAINGSRFGDGLERRSLSGRDYLFHPALRGDFALLRAHRADAVGNLVFQGPRRNWSPVMAMAAAVTIAEVDEVLEPGGLDPELVITPGIFVKRVVRTT